MIFRAKRVDKSNQGKSTHGNEERIQNYEPFAVPTFSIKRRGIISQSSRKGTSHHGKPKKHFGKGK